jgi:hypothetical protein
MLGQAELAKRKEDLLEGTEESSESERKTIHCDWGCNILDFVFFAVPKGEDDIRLVYNVTSSGLNKMVWAP